MLLFVGDDWAGDHHDVEIQGETGEKVVAVRLPEGVEGIVKLHALIARHGGDELESGQVVVGIETDRGRWVQALLGSGCRVFGINRRQVNRFKERYGTSGAKSDKGDAHALAGMVGIDRAQLRPVAGDSAQAQAVKVVARAHQMLIWERTRAMRRLRTALREYFPAALIAYADLTLSGADALELLIKAPDPASAAKLTKAQIRAGLKRTRRHGTEDKAAAIQAGLREEHLTQPEVVAAAYAATTMALAQVITALNEQIKQLEEQVKTHFRAHPDAEIYLSPPGIGDITGARVLAEFGDAQGRYACAKSRKNYAGTDASRPAPPTTRPPPGHITHNPMLLDLKRHGMSDHLHRNGVLRTVPRHPASHALWPDRSTNRF